MTSPKSWAAGPRRAGSSPSPPSWRSAAALPARPAPPSPWTARAPSSARSPAAAWKARCTNCAPRRSRTANPSWNASATATTTPSPWA
ncbi:hypothetical protein STRAU_2763 [Streptomyces aurantiacus JA 4570]|uniref:Uncharacterized protein n=1 Tax=Streptomyces aurantiacus JA 4570 TaxID=1286094 RepID=S3ZM70_9ACTN|nr:hypothetical protein STRAU_2763 [Streptomyces aurantiacus JA 4570]